MGSIIGSFAFLPALLALLLGATIVAAPGSAQTTYPLNALAPLVQNQETSSRVSNVVVTPGTGSVSISFKDDLNNSVSGSFSMSGPATVAGVLGGAILNLTPASTFTARHTLTGTRSVQITILKFALSDPRNCTGTASSVGCSLERLDIASNGNAYVSSVITIYTAGTPSSGPPAFTAVVTFFWSLGGPPSCPALAVASISDAGRVLTTDPNCAVKNEINIDVAFPIPSLNNIAAVADMLPPFCAFGTYSMRESSGPNRLSAHIQLYVLDEQDRVLAKSLKSPAFEPGAALEWGGACTDKTAKNLIIIPEVPFAQLRGELLWPFGQADTFKEPFDKVLGKLRLYARLIDDVSLITLAQSQPITYDIVPGGKLTSADLYVDGSVREEFPVKVPANAVFPNLDYFDDSKGTPAFGGLFRVVAALASGIEDPEDAQDATRLYLKTEVEFPGSAGSLDADIFGISPAGVLVPAALTVSSVPLRKGKQTVELDISGRLPSSISGLIIEPRITLPNDQRIFFPEISLPFNNIAIVSISPDNRKCGLEAANLPQCFSVDQPNSVHVTLAATPATQVGLVSTRRQVFQGSRPDAAQTATIQGVELRKGQTTNFTHDFTAGPFSDPSITEYRVKYTMRDCIASPREVCAGIAHSFHRFLSKDIIKASQLGAIGRFGSAVLEGVKVSLDTGVSSVRSKGSDILQSKLDTLLGNKPTAPKAAAVDPELLWLNATWQFSPALPRDGSFSGKLTLTYTDDSFPADPNFSEGKIQIVSLDPAGVLHIYPTTLDLARNEASTQIDSLDGYYGLAIVGPFAQSPLMMPSAPSGYVLVNAGAQSASLQVANALPDTPAPLAPVTLPALNMRKLDATGWVRAWSDSPSVTGASWQETGKLLAVTPAGKLEQTFLLPGVEFGARKTTEIHLANPAATDTEVTIDLFQANGSRQGTAFQTTLGAGLSLRAPVQTMFPGLPAGFVGYAMIRSQSSISASGLLKTAHAMGALIAQPINSSTLSPTTRFAPVLADANIATLHLVNTGTAPVQSTIRPRTASGAAAAVNLQVTLAAGEQYTRTLVDAFGDTAVASITVTSGASGVLGALQSADSSFNSQYLVSLPLTDQTSANAVLPFAASSTVVPVFNPGAAAASVTATPYSANGVSGTPASATVPAGGRVLLTVSSNGYVIVRSAQAILTAALVTSSSGGMAGYAGIPVSTTGTIPGGGAGPIPSGTAAGVRNAASFATGPIAPGEIVVITGSNIGPSQQASFALDASGKVPTVLGEARVLFDDVPGAMLYSLAGENSVVVPYAIAGKTTVKMVLEYQGRRSDPITLNAAPSSPALYSANLSGAGQGAILNYAPSGTTVNSAQNPIDKGGIITLYGTGEGVVSPPNQDGDVVAGLHNVPGETKVTIGGMNAKVLFAGSAPGLVAGVLQINVEVPANVPSGNQPILVTIGNVTSPAGITVAIKGTPTTQTPAITVEPTSLDFGTVSVNQSKELTLTVRNTGTATLTITNITGTSARFTPVGITVPITIGAGSSRNLTFRFTPIANGAQTGTISITSNDPTRPTLTVTTTGTGGTGGTPTITFGQSITATLTTAAGRASDCDNCYADSYQLTVTQARAFEFRLTSTAFDAYINVLDGNGKFLAADDDGGGGTNARLFGTIQPGIYFIEVTTAISNQTGAYTLSVAP